MGTYVILRKLSFIGDGIAHASFAGIVIAYLRGANYYVGAGIVAVLTALGIGFVHRRGRISLDTTIGVLFTGMFALGVYLDEPAAQLRGRSAELSLRRHSRRSGAGSLADRRA